MAKHVITSSNGGYIGCSDASYSNARLGSGTLSANTSNPAHRIGQILSGGTYTVYETFLEFPTTAVTASELVVSAGISWTRSTDEGTNTLATDSLGIREFDWGTSLTTADYRPGNGFGAFPLDGAMPVTHNADTATGAGSEILRARIATLTSPYRCFIYSGRTTANLAPVADEHWAMVAYSDANKPPHLTVDTLTKSALHYFGSCALQLSDGTSVYVKTDGGAPPVVTLCYYDTSEHTIGTLTTDTGASGYLLQAGYQALAMCRDSADNIYIIGAHEGGTDEIVAQCWKKGAGLTWTKMAALFGSVTGYSGANLNQFATVWHPTTADGHIMTLYAHELGGNLSGDIDGFAVLSAAALKAGSGTLITHTLSGDDAGFTWFTDGGSANPIGRGNGTGFDLIANGTTGVGYAYGGCGKYLLTSAGILTSATHIVTGGETDADSKLRLLYINSTKFVLCDGFEIDVFDYSGNLLGSVNISDGPSAIGTLTANSSWDVIYDGTSNKVWLVYLDSTANRSLRATDYSLTSYAALGTNTLINSTVGVTGSSNLSVRLPRGPVNEQKLRVTVANLSVSTHSQIGVTFAVNVAPNAPALTPKANFDARVSSTFAWTYSDPNPGDTQSAYQLQINNTTTGLSAVDTGQVTSTSSNKTLAASALANGNSYQWRVKTWDASGAVGPYSGYGTFSCSAGSIATITDPATDNPAGLIVDHYAFVWSVSGNAQAQYRVVATRTTGPGSPVVQSDTGFVTSTNTTYTVTGMLTDQTYSVAVTLKDGTGVAGATATRLITASFTNPDTPSITLTPSTDNGYIQVDITNPAPTGSRPFPVGNQIFRRLSNTTDPWVMLAIIMLPESSYQDETVAGGQSYDYYATAIADPTGSTDSAAASASVNLLGVWIHDPSDVAGTLRQFLLGKGRSSAAAVSSAAHVYAGRNYPTYTYGDPQTLSVAVTIQVPFGPDFVSGVTYLEGLPFNRATICYRDGRGRKVFGSVDTVTTQDEDFGSTVTFTVNATDFSEAVA